MQILTYALNIFEQIDKNLENVNVFREEMEG